MKLTKTMHELIEYMKTNGGVIHRHPGGFWAREGYSYLQYSFGTRSVEALVTRGVAEYSEWKDGKSGRFPVTAKLKAA